MRPLVQDGAIRVAFPQGEIVHTEDCGGRERRHRLPAEQAQQGVPAHGHVPLMAEVHPSRPTQRHAEGHEALSEPQRAPCPGGGNGGQSFGEDAAVTGAIAAKPLAHAQLQAHAIRRPGQIGQDAAITTMDAVRRGGTARAGHAGLRRPYAQGNLCCGVIDVTRLKAQQRGIG